MIPHPAEDPGWPLSESAARAARPSAVVRIGIVARAAPRNARLIRPNTIGTPLASPTASMTAPYTAVHSDPTPNASVKYSA